MNSSMTHPIDREDVMAWLDGELSAARALEVSVHIDQCAECRTLVDDLRAVSARLADWSIEPAPQRIATLLAAAEQPAAKPEPIRTGAVPRVSPAWRRVSVWGLPAAAGLALFVFASGPWMGRSVPPPEQEHVEGNRRTPAPPAPPPAPASSAMERSLGVAIQQGQAGEMGPGPMIVRTALLALTTDEFERARAAIERVTAEHGGQVSALDVSGTPPQPRSLRATLRIPSARLDAALAALRQVGRVQQESLASTEVTDQYRDLTVRIANSTREERRLVELLAQRTGDLKDVLAVEQAIARVRGEVERMQAEERAMKGRVDLASVTIQLSENYRADAAIASIAIGTQFRNAFIDGARDALDGVTAAALVIVRIAPTLALWAVLLAWPARKVWQRRRARVAKLT